MENKYNDRYLFFFFESKNPVYLKDNSMLDIVKKHPYFEINSNNQSSFIKNLNIFLKNNSNAEKNFIIINTDNIDLNNQNKICCMVKDKSYQTLYLLDNCKIIVTGNKDYINKELLSLLVMIDV